MNERNRRTDAALFAAVALLSLVLDTGIMRALTAVFGPELGFFRSLHVVELALALGLYLATGPGDSWRLPRSETKRGWLVVPIWLGFIAAVLALRLALDTKVSHSGIVVSTIDFMFVHLVAQELLFRGALVQLANRLWRPLPGDKDLGDVSLPTLFVVSLVFGLAQLQYAETLWSAAPWWQALRAFVLGVFMCGLRGSFRSVWASAAFHAGNNFLVGVR